MSHHPFEDIPKEFRTASQWSEISLYYANESIRYSKLSVRWACYTVALWVVFIIFIIISFLL